MLPVLEKAHSSNVFIDRGTFNSAQGDIHIHSRDSESGLHTLLRLGVSLGAIHDSAERYPPPNCHPDTRQAVRQIILEWIHSESSDSFFWLYGPAGAGKTAILQAIAELLCCPSESDQNFGGSFFFSRGKKGRDDGQFLFSTIAYQLALKVPGLRQLVNTIMESDPSLLTKSMVVQLESLIVDAFKYLSPLPQHSYLVLIDGLDECHDKATQQLILRLLCETITFHKLPLRFLIGSRPESHIRASFDQESLYTITQRVVLDETFNPGRDIRVFLQCGFSKICADNSIMSHVEQPWPSEGIVDLLVQRSSGQFIYAATVLKFVGVDYCSPTKQLALVLKPDVTAFSDLDQLYTQILSVYPSAVNIVQVLGFIIAFERRLPEVIEDILLMEEGQLKLVLRGLSSLMKDENEGVISYVIPHFAHASFSEYLFDSSRSGPFHVNRQEYENQVTIRSFALIMQLIRSWGMSSITRVLHATTWDYFSSRLPGRFIHSPEVVKEVIMTDINDLVQDFWSFWKTSSDGAVGASLTAMRRLHEILQKCFDILEMSANLNSQRYAVYSHLSVHDDRIRAKFKILFDGYRKMLDQLFSKSKDLDDMLRCLPGVVVQKPMSMQGMADLYKIEPHLLERLINSTIEQIRIRGVFPNSGYMLDDYLSGFLRDRDRCPSQLYCDPMLQHVSICRHFLSLLDGSNALQSHDLFDYVSSHFYDHLCGATTDFFLNNSDGHPTIEILHDLENTAYNVQEISPGYILKLARCIIQAILRWADMLYCHKSGTVSVSNVDLMGRVWHLTNKVYREMLCHLKGVTVSVSNVDLMERVCHLTNKIYQEMLCLTRHEGMVYITVRGLDHDHVGDFSWTPQYKIVISWDLLAWISVEDRIPCSFTNFITTPELSGPLYISQDIYHTQITEYSLKTIFSPPSLSSLYHHFVRPVWCYREHLSRALPTEEIFYLLRSISSERLIRDYTAELMLETLEIIINWLQGLGSERPSDLYDRFQGELLRLPQSSSPSTSD